MKWCFAYIRVDAAATIALRRLAFDESERRLFQEQLAELTRDVSEIRLSESRAIASSQRQIDVRLARLTDAYLDGVLAKDEVSERKTALLRERCELVERLDGLSRDVEINAALREFLELAGTAYSAYKIGTPEEKREILETVTSNRCVDGKDLVFTLDLPFEVVANRAMFENGSPSRVAHRTVGRLLKRLMKYVGKMPLRFPTPSSRRRQRALPTHSVGPIVKLRNAS